MEKFVEVAMTYSEQEIKKAVSFFVLSIQKMKKYFLAVYIILAVAIIWILTSDIHIILSPLLMILGYLFFYVYYQRPCDNYVKYYQKRKSSTYKFTDKNISVTCEDFQSVISWSFYKKAYETPTAFLLLDDNKSIYIFPKVFFKKEERALLASLINNNISDFEQFS